MHLFLVVSFEHSQRLGSLAFADPDCNAAITLSRGLLNSCRVCPVTPPGVNLPVRPMPLWIKMILQVNDLYFEHNHVYPKHFLQPYLPGCSRNRHSQMSSPASAVTFRTCVLIVLLSLCMLKPSASCCLSAVERRPLQPTVSPLHLASHFLT